MNERTLEERIKFDRGLPIGQSLVTFMLGERSVLALVEIGPRGHVYYFVRPNEGNVYSSWQQVAGDMTRGGSGGVKVWAHKDAKFMARFDGRSLAVIPVK